MIITSLLASILLVQDTTPARVPAPSVAIPRVDAAVVVDGRLDEPVWREAARLEGFRQYQPVDGRAAEQRTEVLVWYAPTAIHFGIIAHDRDPSSIRATVADRDNLSQEDRVTIYLDTFDDQRRAFFFGVNALGAQEDGVRSEGQLSAGSLFTGSVDRNPDYTWDSKGVRTDSGYVVEIRIPFKSLRYPARPVHSWGLNIVRVTQRNGYEDTWADTRRANASFLAQSGRLTGLSGLQRGVVVEAQPHVVGALTGARDPATGEYVRDDFQPDAGGNVRLGFTNFSLDATVNPDFSTVESDEGQVTVNERFALFFPEKRPFFLEGIELFSTPNQLIYTRRIGNPIAGAKFTGKFGRLATAYLAALDDVGDDEAIFNVGRLRYDLGAASTAGVTLTDRRGDRTGNTVAAADAHIVFARLYFLEAQLGNAWTETADTSRQGEIWKLEFDRTGRSWGFNYQLNGVADDFASASGFVNRTGVISGRAFNRLSFYGARGAMVENFTTFFGLERVWDYGDFAIDDAVEGSESANFNLAMRGGWRPTARVSRAFFGFSADDFASYTVDAPGGPSSFVQPDELSNLFLGKIGVVSPTFQSFGADLTIDFGEAPIFAEAAYGHGYSISAGLTVRPVPSMRWSLGTRYVKLFRDTDGSEFARSIIPRLKLEYQPSRALFFRAITEYRAERQSALQDPASGYPLLVGGEPADGIATNGFQADLLASYEPTPGTAIFLGYGARVADDGAFAFQNLQRQRDALFFKVSYLWRR